MKILGKVLLILLGVGFIVSTTYAQKVIENIHDGWETSIFENQGIDRHLIDSLLKQIEEGGYVNIHSLLIVKNHKIVLDEYFQGYTC